MWCVSSRVVGCVLFLFACAIVDGSWMLDADGVFLFFCFFLFCVRVCARVCCCFVFLALSRCMLIHACCLVFGGSWLLFVVYVLMSVLGCSLFVVSCLIVVRCLMCVV